MHDSSSHPGVMHSEVSRPGKSCIHTVGYHRVGVMHSGVS